MIPFVRISAKLGTIKFVQPIKVMKDVWNRILKGFLCSLRMYNALVERCFTDCVESFRRKDLDSTEERVSSLVNHNF